MHVFQIIRYWWFIATFFASHYLKKVQWISKLMLILFSCFEIWKQNEKPFQLFEAKSNILHLSFAKTVRYFEWYRYKSFRLFWARFPTIWFRQLSLLIFLSGSPRLLIMIFIKDCQSGIHHKRNRYTYNRRTYTYKDFTSTIPLFKARHQNLKINRKKCHWFHKNG